MPIDKAEVRGVDPSFAAWDPQSDADREAVRKHLRRVLATPAFTASKRYPNFLRHVVERALQGQTDTLKERSLGVEVFHRDPAYDTSLDPVVRTTASEVRKRLGHYYSQARSCSQQDSCQRYAGAGSGARNEQDQDGKAVNVCTR